MLLTAGNYFSTDHHRCHGAVSFNLFFFELCWVYMGMENTEKQLAHLEIRRAKSLQQRPRLDLIQNQWCILLKLHTCWNTQQCGLSLGMKVAKMSSPKGMQKKKRHLLWDLSSRSQRQNFVMWRWGTSQNMWAQLKPAIISFFPHWNPDRCDTQ